MVAPGITVNGHSASLEGVPPHTTALDWLRDRGLTGCKEGCAEGECGACSVLVARPALDAAEATEWVAINACLVPVAALDGQELVTAEGLGTPDALHPVQHEMARPRRLAVRLLHPGVRVQHGRGVLPRPDARSTDGRRSADRRARRQRLRPARAERQPVPLHGLPADPRRRIRARLPGRRRPARLPGDGHRRRRLRPPGLHDGRGGVRPARRRSPRHWPCCATHPDATVVAGCTDWGSR